jgi:REP element-mobilizing transposase RayT
MSHKSSILPERNVAGASVRPSGWNYNPAIHHRRSIRLKGYDYSQPGLYFVTMNCQHRKRLFGEIRNGEMIMNGYGKIVHEAWRQTPLIRPGVSIEAFVVMPDHFHAIIRINETSEPRHECPAHFTSPSRTVGAIIRGFKGATTKKIKERWLAHMREREASQEPGRAESPQADSYPPRQEEPGPAISIDQKIWQRDYYEIIIRDERALRNISRYIIENPRRADSARADSDPPRRERLSDEPGRAESERADSDPPRREEELSDEPGRAESARADSDPPRWERLSDEPGRAESERADSDPPRWEGSL